MSTSCIRRLVAIATVNTVPTSRIQTRFRIGSVLVQYSSFDPATLRRQANPQLAFLAHPNGEAYSSQITEQASVAATTWTAPVAMSANPNANPANYQQRRRQLTIRDRLR